MTHRRPGWSRNSWVLLGLVVSWALLVLAVVSLALLLFARGGGCDRAPPDDDEPVPACPPGSKECHGAAEPAPGSSPKD